MLANAVNDVLENLVSACTSAKAHHSPPPAVSVNAYGFNNAHLVSPIVVNQQRPAVTQTVQAHAFRRMVQNFDTVPAFNLNFG